MYQNRGSHLQRLTQSVEIESIKRTPQARYNKMDGSASYKYQCHWYQVCITKHNKIINQFYFIFIKSTMMMMKEGSSRIIAVTLTLLLCFLTADSEVRCIESERHALLNFKQDLEDPSNRLASWAAAAAASDVDCCDWIGVVCHNRTGHVLQLHLRTFYPLYDVRTGRAQHYAQYEAYERSMFGGKINPSLLDLKHLIYLDLSYNNFSGIQIPKFLGSMGSLRYLNLSHARFGRLIPRQLGNLSNLQYLQFFILEILIIIMIYMSRTFNGSLVFLYYNTLI